MASQQFCLKWNNHTNNMLTIFENLLSTEAFVDVTLACDGLSLKAHKMVLSACSPFFQSLFLENPCKHPIVIMKDMNYKDLKAIIDFMYHGEVNVSQDQLSALLKTAETLKVKGLAEVGGENRQATSGLVQQEVVPSQQNSIPIPTSSSTPQPSTQQRRVDSPPLHGKRKRGRPRKRSLSDSNRSDDEMVPTKIKEPDSPEIEELSGDASMEGVNNDMLRQGSNSSQGPMHSSVNSFSSKHARSNAQVEEVPSGEENEFEVEPSKLLEQTLTTDNVPSMSNAASSSSVSSGNFNLPSSSGMEISTIGMSGDAQALVPVSATSDSLSSSHLQGPDSPQDIKPAILTFEDPPLSPSAGTSQSMVYMDQSSLPGPSSYQDNSLVQHDAQPQGMSVRRKQNYCSVKDKLEALKRLDQGESATKLAEEFGIGRTTISDWKKNRSRLEQFCSYAPQESLSVRRTLKVSPHARLDGALYVWIMQERQSGRLVNGPMIQEKARQLNVILQGDPSFIASNGWLNRWKNRYGIK